MNVDTSKWSGEGEFTHSVVEVLKQLPSVAFIRVEDAPATRADSGYSFIANEVFVGFASLAATMAELGQALENADQIGPADYSDEGMIQYLKTQRIIPPYQTRGYKLVELVRIYRIGDTPRR